MNLTISSTAKARASRLLLFAPPKWGKTSWAAYAPDPVFLMTRGEDGLLTLLSYGRVPETPHFDEEATRWRGIEEAVDYLTTAKHDRRTLVIDTINGAIQLLLEAVCEEKYDGDWKEFEAYGRGINVAIPRAAQFVEKLEQLRQRRNMSVILLCHSRIKTQKNPSGADFDQFQPEMPDKIANHFHKWADCLLYGGFEVRENKAGQMPGKVKVDGQGIRTILTGESASHVAGNRYGLPRVIRGGVDARQTWDAFANAMKAARPKQAAVAVQPAAPPVEQPAPKVATGADSKPATGAAWAKKFEQDAATALSMADVDDLNDRLNEAGDLLTDAEYKACADAVQAAYDRAGKVQAGK